MKTKTYKVLQVFAGIGGACRGFLDAGVEYRGVRAQFRSIGAIDVDPGACETLERLCPGTRASRMDLFTREQYTAFHGAPPPEGWREATPADMLEATGGERPDVVFSSPPCKGFSGLLSNENSKSIKYQALNELVTRWLFLTLEAWADNPVGLYLLENVPRIGSRGRSLLDIVERMFLAYGYVCRMSVHNCGEIGGLGQNRNRFLVVARHISTVPSLLFEPPKRKMRSIGDVVAPLGVPGLIEGDRLRNPLHVVPEISEVTWTRLACIREGKDWRDVGARASAKKGEVIGPRWAPGMWSTVPLGGNVFGLVGGTSGESLPDPRVPAPYTGNVYGVRPIVEPSVAVTGQPNVGSGVFAIADARVPSQYRRGVLGIQVLGQPSGTVTGETWPSNGAFSITDPSLGCNPRNGVYGVMDWDKPAITVTGSIDVHVGTAAVAAPAPTGPLVLVPGFGRIILSDDGKWHRPLTDDELRALQDFPEGMTFATTSVVTRRMWIGNAVPVGAARYIAECALSTLLAADEGGI